MRATGRHKMHFPKKTTHFPNVLNNRFGDLTKPYAIFHFFFKKYEATFGPYCQDFFESFKVIVRYFLIFS